MSRPTVLSLLALSLLTACEASSTAATDAGSDAGTEAVDARTAERDAFVPGRDAMVEGEDLAMEAEDFGCILDWDRVGNYRITNLLGHTDEALAVARSAEGGTFPVGTVIQLVPGEAMVKRGRGWSPMTNDWEFFALDVTASGTSIRTRGAEETVNAFGGNCFECHSRAAAQWDMICGADHGCDPLPLSTETLIGIQERDARCAR